MPGAKFVYSTVFAGGQPFKLKIKYQKSKINRSLKNTHSAFKAFQHAKDIQRHSYAGAGKPEHLKHALSVWWSRRINNEHRIVYKIKDDSLLIAQLRYHY
jgi:Txe/YoeB family toxin of toxin-antitoxin system